MAEQGYPELDFGNWMGVIAASGTSPELVAKMHAALARVGANPKVRERLGSACLGLQPLPEVMALMQSASFLVLPSLWYEGFPRTIVEAFASGTPVLASRLGAMSEVIQDGVTGLLFTPGVMVISVPFQLRSSAQRARELREQIWVPPSDLRAGRAVGTRSRQIGK